MAVRVFVKRQVSDDKIEALREFVEKLRNMAAG